MPRPRLTLDLARVRAELQSAGYSVIDARVMLIARREVEMTIAQDGRVLIKGAEAAQAHRAFEEIRPLLVGAEHPAAR